MHAKLTRLSKDLLLTALDSNHKFQIRFKTCFVVENTSPAAFLGVSLLVVAASVFPQICQGGFAEINYLSSSEHEGPGGCVVSERVTPAALSWMLGYFGFLDNKLVAWEA